MKKILVLTAIVMLFLFSLFIFSVEAQINNSKNISKSIEASLVSADQVGTGWELISSFYATSSVVSEYGNTLGADLKYLKSEVFQNVNEKKKLQINYIEAANTKEALNTFEKLVKKVGNYNVIALKDTIVAEIVAADANAKIAVLAQLKAKKVHKNY